MRKYRGLYIDHVYFHNTAEIDEYLKAQAIKSYKRAIKAFCNHMDMEHSIYADKQAECLNKQFGMSWTEIEEIEIEAMTA